MATLEQFDNIHRSSPKICRCVALSFLFVVLMLNSSFLVLLTCKKLFVIYFFIIDLQVSTRAFAILYFMYNIKSYSKVLCFAVYFMLRNIYEDN